MTVEETVKDFWATRPRRPRSGRVVAGVAAGIGRRYAIDPVIVRVALVVAAVYGGAGILIYLIGWLLLPAEGDEVSPAEAMLGRGRSSMSRGLALVLCVALIPASNFVLFGGHFSTVAGIVVSLGALYLLHRNRGHLGSVDTAAPTAPAGGTTTMTDTTVQDAVPPHDGEGGAEPVEDAVPTARTQPPAWDPLGAAPFAWDLPEPTPATPAAPPPPERRRKTRIGLATLGIVLVTGASLVALSGGSGWLNGGHIAGILTAVTGVGLIAGAFAHGGRGLIPLAVVLAAAGFALTATHYDGWHGAGDNTFRPAAISQVHPRYDLSAGNIRLDLTNLPSSGHVTTALHLGVGNATVLVPAGAEVHATCSASLGDVDCLGQGAHGANNPTVTADQQAAPGNTLTIDLDVEDGPGQVRVISGG